jgi:hypothetical protein
MPPMTRRGPPPPRSRPVDAALTIRIGFHSSRDIAGVAQGNVKVDKPLLNERPA